MKFWISLFIVVLLILVSIPASAEINSNTRMLQKPEWDGAIISGMWLNTEFRYQQYEVSDNEDGDAIVIGPTFATSLPGLPQLELGTRLWLINLSYDDYDSEFGFSDVDIWGKYQFINNNELLLSVGLMLSLPVGSDEIVHQRATGEMNIELFGSARYHANRLCDIVGHIGFRRNGDMEYDLEGKGRTADTQGELDGETQIELGGGVIYQLRHDLNFLGELNFSTEPYDDSDNDIELTIGLEYMLKKNMTIKGGLGLGLDDGAPDIELIAGCALTF